MNKIVTLGIVSKHSNARRQRTVGEIINKENEKDWAKYRPLRYARTYTFPETGGTVKNHTLTTRGKIVREPAEKRTRNTKSMEFAEQARVTDSVKGMSEVKINSIDFESLVKSIANIMQHCK